jgi:hypothetical protein
MELAIDFIRYQIAITHALFGPEMALLLVACMLIVAYAAIRCCQEIGETIGRRIWK